jgi:hypothetical protein
MGFFLPHWECESGLAAAWNADTQLKRTGAGRGTPHKRQSE